MMAVNSRAVPIPNFRLDASRLDGMEYGGVRQVDYRAFLRDTSPGMTIKRKMREFHLAASPPTEDTLIATEPLTKEDLVSYLFSGCKPKENWR